MPWIGPTAAGRARWPTRLRLGFRAPRGSPSKRRGALLFGVLLLSFGCWVACGVYGEYGLRGPFWPGVVVAVAGASLVAAGVALPEVDVLRVFGGVVAALLGVGCVVAGLGAAVLMGPRYLPLVPMGGLWLVGAALSFDLRGLVAARGRHTEDDVSRFLGGGAAVCAGLALAGQVLADPSGMSPGVPPWVGGAAAGVFFLAGVLILAGGRGGLLGPLTVAVFVSLFAALSLAVFPPGGLFVAFVAVLGWIAFCREVHRRVTGRDPLGGLSDARQLGVGCLVYLVLLGVVAAATRWL